MENLQHRRRQNAAGRDGDSRHLLRSKSGSASSVTFTSTSESEKPARTSSKKTQKKEEVDNGFVRFLPRSMSKIEVPRRMRSTSTSPSAWALSPGRSALPCPSPALAALQVPKSPASHDKLMKQETTGSVRGGGMNGVLKYFRGQKKVSPLLEEDYHRFRVVYNRFLQWRFANARAEASMAAVKKVAQKKVFNGWIRISIIRNIIAEKRILVHKLKHVTKAYQILNSEMRMLNEWSGIEPKNVEAVGRVVRKLSAISLCLPLVQNAEGDIMSVCDDMSPAIGVMNEIKAMILDMHWQVERTCFLLTELSVMLKQQKQFFQELERSVGVFASLEVIN
ncbi:hypothetical protein CDL12_12276 [Handroanthus impetiginosus]|uniref:QWRF family protein n=1 Tax=Handroanthus impetiginosus TaxID=429701 RepID=A0A2G9HC68_9LAMI|nr:hypothetical protein CDL12_12276 [Handroanthus impetiginosus]